ncbi:hypothetical protein P691DRAFT_680809 [Macrolepiota fuliginosa MF-IS2]|uniref:G domain-containing protein n=1 Tax=Macrolepiota fuliginosa MF-IS2 TaxID=1400762 RepID=A0A9P5X3M3_9AGAR|nr:hypothetical protein P691DRAFT_680809 [Macrolepiota fuliginosa MF-IS2]
MARRNVVIFGASGCGKSSIVNMLSDGYVADTAEDAEGRTFQSRNFNVNVLGQPMTLWDTVGFDEGEAGTVPNIDAIVQLYALIRQLSDGVSLLMFVMRAPRIRDSVPRNWKLFREIVCQSKVPTVIVITGLELVANRNRWWWDNQERFQDDGIFPAGHACITATRGRQLAGGAGHLFDQAYRQSTRDVRELIRSTALHRPWQVPAAEWFKNTFIAVLARRIFGMNIAGGALKKLVSDCNMSKSDAMELAKRMRDAGV